MEAKALYLGHNWRRITACFLCVLVFDKVMNLCLYLFRHMQTFVEQLLLLAFTTSAFSMECCSITSQHRERA